MSEVLFRYLAARWRHPGASAKQFMRAGLGLENRARHLSMYWSEHFSRTRAAQARWAQTCSGQVLTVLGAGPLLDFNVFALAPKFQRLRLVDANPLLVPDWGRRLNKPLEPVITDITNCLDQWTESVKGFRGNWEQTLAFISGLAQTPVKAYSASSDALLSLNILSQLEIAWQEALEPVLEKRFGRRFTEQNEQDWLDAIRHASQALAEQHLAALEASGAPDILLITDVDYVEYTGRNYVSHRLESAPMQWNETGWQADENIKYQVIPALEGLSLSQDNFARWMPSYELEWHESWIWHIAPNGTETTEFGKLHRVAAFALRQRVVMNSVL